MVFVLERYLEKEDGTYDRDTGEPKIHEDGFSVSIHQNKSDNFGRYKNHTGQYRSAYDYRNKLMKVALKYGLEVNVGVFHHEVEVSFWTPEEEIARMLAQKYNQYAYYDNAKKCKILNPAYKPEKNPMAVEKK